MAVPAEALAANGNPCVSRTVALQIINADPGRRLELNNGKGCANCPSDRRSAKSSVNTMYFCDQKGSANRNKQGLEKRCDSPTEIEGINAG